MRSTITILILLVVVLSLGCISFDSGTENNNKPVDSGKINIPNVTEPNNSGQVISQNNEVKEDIRGDIVLSSDYSFLNNTNNRVYIRVSNGRIYVWNGSGYKVVTLTNKRDFFRYFNFLFDERKYGYIDVKISEVITGETYYLSMRTGEFFGSEQLSIENKEIYNEFYKKFYNMKNKIPYGLYDIRIVGKNHTYSIYMEVSSDYIPSYVTSDKIRIIRDQIREIWNSVQLSERISMPFGINVDSWMYKSTFNREVYIVEREFLNNEGVIKNNGVKIDGIIFMIPDDMIDQIVIVNNTPPFEINSESTFYSIDLFDINNSTIYLVLKDGTLKTIDITGSIQETKINNKNIDKNVSLKLWTPSYLINFITSPLQIPDGNEHIFTIVYSYGRYPSAYYNTTYVSSSLSTIYPSKLYLVSNKTPVTHSVVLDVYNVYNFMYEHKNIIKRLKLITIENMVVPYYNNDASSLIRFDRLPNDYGNGALYIIIIDSVKNISLYYLDPTGKIGEDYGVNGYIGGIRCLFSS